MKKLLFLERMTNRDGSFIAAFILYYMTLPFFFWGEAYNNPYVRTILTYLMGFLFLRRYQSQGRKFFMPFLMLIILYYAFNSGFNLLYSLSLVPLVLIPFANEKFTKDVYQNFLSIYCLIVFIGLISWLFAVAGFLSPLGYIPPLNPGKDITYSVYPLLVMFPDSVRFCGPFDEPGVIGTLSGILLCIQQFNLKDRRTILLLISGFCSLSFFFYALVAVYFLLYFVVEKKSVKSTFLFLLTIVIVMLILQKVPFLNEILGQRFVWDADRGWFTGDNRLSVLASDYWVSLIGTHGFWFGIEDKEWYMELAKGSSSIINVFVVNGMLLFILYIIFYIYYGIINRKDWYSFLLMILVVILTIYQRPGLFAAEFIFLWTFMARGNLQKSILIR
ncbi:MAG: hypothetical protein PHG64_09920 [Paludibacter sp.]|nr:hypothetical protein [Paludibacter sp.]